MTTSGTYTLSKTANEIANSILRLIGVVGEGQAASSQQVQDTIEAINFWLLQYKGPENVGKPGLMMWLRESAELSLTTAQYLYELQPSGGDLDIQIPVEIISASLRDTDDTDTALLPMTRIEYEAISGKTESGTPSKYYYEKRIDTGYFYLDHAPDSSTASSTIRIVYRQPIEVITSGSETIDIEDYWYRAIRFNVALDIAAEYGIEPPQIVFNRAADAMAIINTFYPEDIGNLFFESGRD